MLLQKLQLDGKVAIVTGAGRGIGRACALALAEAGADVALAARTPDQISAVATEAKDFGVRALALPTDVLADGALEALVDRVVAEFGGIDIVVNNAGGSPPRAFLDTSERMFEMAFTFNVTTAFRLSKLAVPHMLKREDGGAIVNISSSAGRLTSRGFVAYGTAKAALAHMTRLLATDCAPRVRVNAIAVGSVETSALATVVDDDAIRERMEEGIALGRLGQPEDIALSVLFLASPASSWITGKIMEVDGGMEAVNMDLGLPDL